MKPIVTVFTPTYNRAYRLTKAYESLKKQTDKCFEWIIVDDGSTDNTKDLVETWLKYKNGFKISYYFQKNSGKHIAINFGVKHAAGKLFLILDSDDYLKEDAIEIIIHYANSIKDKKRYGGVVGNKAYFDDITIGRTFEGNIKDINFFQREKYGISGDKAEVFYTEVLKLYPFPKFKNEKFCTEALVWNRIAKDGWIFRFFNENIYYAEYLDDGLSKKYWKLMYENPIQASIYYKELSQINKYFTFKDKIINQSLAVIFEYEAIKKLNKIKEELNINIFELFIYFLLGSIHKVKHNA